MKNIICLIAGAIIFTACSTPKYAYHFDHYDYNSGRKQTQKIETASVQEISPLAIDQSTIVADASDNSVVVADVKTTPVAKQTVTEKATRMSKAEKKELKQALKTYLKQIKKNEIGKTTEATKAWDRELKMAAIFGAVGLVLTALGGFNTVFWVLGTIALVVAVVFLIMWLARQ